MRAKLNGILTLLLVLSVQFVFAQKTISGTVSDEAGPLPGVNVIIKGTKTGVETDFDGKYSIQAKQGDILQFSYIGMQTIEKTVGQGNTIDIIMFSDNTLEEVVVVAYGNKTKDQLTSAVSVVTSEEMGKLSPSTSIDNMLQGKAAGVQVTAQNGKPGQTAYVRIRGIGSINASSAPLYVIDGVVAPDMNSINPNDIESISVLKDAATASLYGSRAANGVILIKTKTGKKNQDATITFSSRVGWGQKTPDNFKMMNAKQKIQYESELALLGVSNAVALPGASANTQSEIDYLLSLDTDWQKTLLKKANLQSNSLSLTGGSENMSYFLSLNNDKNDGILKDIDGFQRQGGRLNLNFQAKDWLEIGTNLSIYTSSTDEPRDRNNVQNPFRAMYDYNPYETKYEVDEDGNVVYDENGNPIYNLTRSGFSISEALVNNPENEYYTTITAGISATTNLSKEFKNTFNLGGTNISYRREYFIKPGSVLDGYVGDPENPGIKTDNGSNDYDYTLTNILSYNKIFADKHDLKLSGLFEFNKNRYRTYRLESQGYVSGDLSVQSISTLPSDVSTTLIEAASLSYGAFLDYDFDSKYIVTASIRRDGSSVFGENNRYGVFWSASAAWNLHNDILKESKYVDELKLRASIGTSGNRAGIDYYQSLAEIGFGSLGGQAVAIPLDNGNPDLKWEKNKIWDIGIEFKTFKRRFSGVIDYFQRTTSDLLLDKPLSSLGGEPDGSIFSNVGTMVNKGLELELTGDIIKTENLKFTIGGNFAMIDNEVTKLVPNDEYPDGAPITRNNGITRLEVGEEVNTFYLPRWAGVNPANGEPLFYDIDGNVTNEYNSDNAVMLSGKSPYAKFDGGVNFFVDYKGIDLSADFYYKVGHYIMNYMESNMLSDGTGVDANQRVDAFNYWRNPGDTNVLPSPLYGNEAQQSTDRFLQKGDYVRLRSLTLGYDLPTKYIDALKMKSLRFFLQGQNLWIYAPHYKGDPEVGIGSGETANSVFGTYSLYSYPQTQSISLGIDIKF